MIMKLKMIYYTHSFLYNKHSRQIEHGETLTLMLTLMKYFLYLGLHLVLLIFVILS
jgi:hypothetical protein